MRKIVGLLIIAILFTSSCADKEAQQEREDSITLGTFSRAIDYSPFYVAKHFNWFSQGDALTVNFREFGDRPTISTAFESGELDFLFAAEPPAIICRAQGNDIRIVGLSCTLQQEIVVRSDLPIGGLADLRDRKVAVLQGTSSHYGLLKILGLAGLNGNDIDLQFMGPAEAKAAFESGRIDAWAVWPPFVEEQQVSGRGRVLTGGDAVIQSIVAVRTALLENEEGIVRSVVGAVEKAKAWIRDNPEEAQSIVAGELGLDIQVVKTAWAKHNWSADLDESVVNDIQAKAAFLATEESTRLEKALDVRDTLIDRRFAKSGKPAV